MAYKIIAATDKELVGTDVDYVWVCKHAASGWRHTFIKDRNVHLLHRTGDLGSVFIEVSKLSLEDTFTLAESGN